MRLMGIVYRLMRDCAIAGGLQVAYCFVRDGGFAPRGGWIWGPCPQIQQILARCQNLSLRRVN